MNARISDASIPYMNTERWQRIEEVPQAAVECDPSTRTRLLEDLCGPDGELRQEVDALLASLDESEQFLRGGIQREAERVTAYGERDRPAGRPLSHHSCIGDEAVGARFT